MRKIPVSEPFLGKEELSNVKKAFREKALSGLCGNFIPRFESAFARYSDCSFGVAVNSGTTALHLALAALNIGAGDEVLVSTFTNMATCFAVIYQNALPVPVDIEPDTWNINPKLLEEKITAETRAILVVHIYGHPCDMNPILNLARKHRLYVIEDCAEAHGATYKGKKVGSFGDIGCFSFYANKIITTGEGGMATTNNRKLYERLQMLKSLAFGKDNKFMHQDIGFGYRMTNIQAAIGLAQLKRIERIIGMKREIAKFYNKHLSGLKGIQLPVEKPYARNVYWMYHIVLKDSLGIPRSKFMELLAKEGIETREAFIPFNMQDIFIERGLTRPQDCPVANRAGEGGFYIPSGPSLDIKSLRRVVSAIKKIYSR